jgi:hypothetical protein
VPMCEHHNRQSVDESPNGLVHVRPFWVTAEGRSIARSPSLRRICCSQWGKPVNYISFRYSMQMCRRGACPLATLVVAVPVLYAHRAVTSAPMGLAPVHELASASVSQHNTKPRALPIKMPCRSSRACLGVRELASASTSSPWRPRARLGVHELASASVSFTG